MNSPSTAATAQVSTKDLLDKPKSLTQRVQSIDVLRGIVMVIMALDHTRDFFLKIQSTNATDLAMDPTNMRTTTPVLFFTRWITHFCAPTFVFLTGASAWLMSQKKSKKELSLFLIKRGFWLLFVEFFIISFGWTFNPFYNAFILQVIWAIGVSMIILGILVNLPSKLILAIGLIIVFGHNLLDYPSINAGLKGSVFSDLAYFSNFAFYSLDPSNPNSFLGSRFVLIVYSFLPWTGLMCLGYCFGKIYGKDFDPKRRRKLLLIMGSAITALFFILRAINLYGDPSPWAQQPRGTIITILSFLNATKYPVSLIYLCMTLGPAMILLALLENIRNGFTKIMNVYGRVPLFYYILHFYILHIFMVIAFFASGYTTSQIVTPNSPFLFKPPDFGFPLWGVYVVWLLCVIILYPLCKRYDQYKSTHKNWWLSYL
jgi:uncharacterized membrane protein